MASKAEYLIEKALFASRWLLAPIFLGLSLALVMRLLLLASISWVVRLTTPLFNVAGLDFAGRDIILILGGIFLLVQDRMDEVREMSQATAFGDLFVRTVQPTTVASEVERTIDAIERIVGVVSVASLHFRPTAAAYLTARKSVATLAPVG